MNKDYLKILRFKNLIEEVLGILIKIDIYDIW